MDNPQAEKHLQDLKNEDSDIRYEAARALGEIGDEYTVPFLIEAMSDDYYMVRHASQSALIRIGAPAIPSLIEALKNRNYQLRYYRIRCGVVEVFQTIRNPATIPALAEVLKDKREIETLRCEVVYALGEIEDTSIIPILGEALQDENHTIRGAAACALVKFGDWSALSPLTEALNDEDAEVRWSAADALTCIGKPAIPIFADRLRGSTGPIRQCALYGLGVVGDVSIVPLLMDVLQDGDADTRFYAAVALENMGDSKTLPRKILAHSEWSAEERVKLLETLRSVYYEGGNFVGYKFDGYKRAVYYRFPATLALCQAVLKEKDAAAHKGAQEVLNWLFLLRGSQSDPNKQPEELLRSAPEGDPEARARTLLRAAREPEEVEIPMTKQPTFWQRLFGKPGRDDS